MENRRIPTRVNLDHIGVDLDLVRCPSYDNDLETEDHILVKCEVAASVWVEVLNWWNKNETHLDNLNDIFSIPSIANLSPMLTSVLDRNDSPFVPKRPNRRMILNDVKLFTFNWISNRDHSYGQRYYACPNSKPGTTERGCGYFMWMDASPGPSTPQSHSPGTSSRPSHSPGTSSRPSHSPRSAQNLGMAECSNCKFLAERIKTLEARISVLEGQLEMERHPENHTLESAGILHEIYQGMRNLNME
ncbi:hypothetical protein Tco_0313704 [Tanacetum coccineum]